MAKRKGASPPVAAPLNPNEIQIEQQEPYQGVDLDGMTPLDLGGMNPDAPPPNADRDRPEFRPEPVSPEPPVELGKAFETPEGEAEAAETPEEAATSAAFLGYVKDNYGLDLSGKYQDDQKALEGLVHAYRKVGEHDDDAKLGREIKPYMPYFQTWMQQQYYGQQQAPQQAQQPTQQPQQAPQQQKPWDIPEFDLSWVRLDEKNEVVPAPGAPPDAVQRYHRYAAETRKAQERLLRDPQSTLAPVFDNRYATKDELRGIVQQAVAENFVVNDAQQFIRDNQNWLFDGGQMASGQLSPAGQVFLRNWQEAQNLGLGYEQAKAYAQRTTWSDIVSATQQSPRPGGPATGVPIPGQRNPNAQAAIHTGNAQTPVAPDDVDSRLPLDEQMRRSLRRNGLMS